MRSCANNKFTPLLCFKGCLCLKWSWQWSSCKFTTGEEILQDFQAVQFGRAKRKGIHWSFQTKSRLLFLMRNEATLTRGAKSHFSFPSALVWEVFLLPGDSCMDFVIWGLRDFHPQRIPDPFVHTANSLDVPASSTLSSRNCSENSKSVTLESPGDPNSLPPSQMFLNQTEL